MSLVTNRTDRSIQGIHPLAQPGMSKLKPYQPGKHIRDIAKKWELNEKDIIKLASNENPLGPAPHARLALRDYFGNENAPLHRYPDSTWPAAKAALGALLNLPIDCIFMVNSGNEGINDIERTFLTAGENIIVSQVGFPMYEIGAYYQNAEVLKVINDGYHHNLEGILQAITPLTKVVFLDSPSNPLGTAIERNELEDFLAKIRQRSVITVLDEAYYGFPDLNHPRGHSYTGTFPNLIILRSFSKLYGLADARLGYCLADPLTVSTLDRARPPFYLPSYLEHGLVAAITKDQDHVANTIENNRIGKTYLYEQLNRLGIRYVKTQANFIFYPIENDESMPNKATAAELEEEFEQRGVIVRLIGNIGLRITIGLPEENERVIQIMTELRERGRI